MLVLYATAEGQKAQDGEGAPNSPFAQALAERLADHESVEVLLSKVAGRVRELTAESQRPEEQGNLDRLVYLAGDNGAMHLSDRDGDGVPDERDICPDIPAGSLPDLDANRRGCPDKIRANPLIYGKESFDVGWGTMAIGGILLVADLGLRGTANNRDTLHERNDALGHADRLRVSWAVFIPTGATLMIGALIYGAYKARRPH